MSNVSCKTPHERLTDADRAELEEVTKTAWDAAHAVTQDRQPRFGRAGPETTPIVEPHLVTLRWVEEHPRFHMLMLGRIELAQICEGYSSKDWFYTLRFTADDERPCYSDPLFTEAKRICEAHAAVVMADTRRFIWK